MTTLRLIFAVGARPGLAALAIMLIWLYWVCHRFGLRRTRWGLDIVLILAALPAVWSYFDFYPWLRAASFMNDHDVYHYYMGSKYSREAGYLDLYQCTTVASWETHGKKPCHTQVRRMDTYRYLDAKAIVAEADKYRARFTPERWEEFKKDCTYFEVLHGKTRWKNVVVDMGYNATPVWNMLGRFLANRAPTSSPNAMRVLVALDILLLAIMFMAIGRAFDWRTALFALLFFCTSYSLYHRQIRGGFLRDDWLVCLVLTLCLLKTQRFKLAGVLLGYAGAARVFPFIFAWGPASRFSWDLLRARRIPWRQAAFFIALGVMAALLALLCLWDDGGTSLWTQFAQKIKVHNEHVAPARVGFKYIFLGVYKSVQGSFPKFKAEQIQYLQDHRVRWYGIQLLMLAACWLAARKLEHYESVALGYIPAFFLTAPTYYYHVMLLVGLFLFLPKRDAWPRCVGVSLLFGVSIIMYFCGARMRLDMPLMFTMSSLLLGCCVFMWVFALCVRPQPAEPAPEELPEKEAPAGAPESNPPLRARE